MMAQRLRKYASQSGFLAGQQDRQAAIVIIVDDDAAVRESLDELMASVGLQSLCFGSIDELLKANVLSRPGCLILDVRMPGLSGLEFQHQLIERGTAKPIVFITGHGDIPMSVQAIKAGAIDFLTKPVRDQTLLDAVLLGIQLDFQQQEEASIAASMMSLVNQLTRRECQVLSEIVNGRLNKQIAYDFGISEVTVKLHRSNIKRKLGVTSVSDMVIIWNSVPTEQQESLLGR